MKRIQTNLPVTIESSFEHAPGDVLESVRQQVEIGIFHLQTLFKMAKRSAESIGSTLDDEEGDLEEFLYDVRNTSDLGYAVTMSIWTAISELTELQRQSDQPNEIESSGENDLLTTGKASIIALAVSNLLNNESVPKEIKNALRDGLGEMQNGIPQTEVLRIEISPAYISGILTDYQKTNGGKR